MKPAKVERKDSWPGRQRQMRQEKIDEMRKVIRARDIECGDSPTPDPVKSADANTPLDAKR